MNEKVPLEKWFLIFEELAPCPLYHFPLKLITSSTFPGQARGGRASRTLCVGEAGGVPAKPQNSWGLGIPGP